MKRRMLAWIWTVAAASLGLPWPAQAATAMQAPGSNSPDPDKLWKLVHGACAAAAEHGVYPPAPCVEVAAPRGVASAYAVLKDRNGSSQYLVLPLARIAGIESPILRLPDVPNYFADAWSARLYVEAALHRELPRDWLSLAVNSAHGRTQDQLHIHIDCLRPDVHQALLRLLPRIGAQWAPLDEPLPPKRHRYRAMRVSGEALPIDPFRSLAASLPKNDRMDRHSLIVVGASSAPGQPGFVLLSGSVDPRNGDNASSDELQDHTCAIATTSTS